MREEGPKNLPTIEEDIRPFLLTDPRCLNPLERKVSGSQQVQNQLEELGVHFFILQAISSLHPFMGVSN